MLHLIIVFPFKLFILSVNCSRANFHQSFQKIFHIITVIRGNYLGINLLQVRCLLRYYATKSSSSVSQYIQIQNDKL